MYKETYIRNFTETIFVRAKNLKQSQHPSTNEWSNPFYRMQPLKQGWHTTYSVQTKSRILDYRKLTFAKLFSYISNFHICEFFFSPLLNQSGSLYNNDICTHLFLMCFPGRKIRMSEPPYGPMEVCNQPNEKTATYAIHGKIELSVDSETGIM